MKKSKRALRGCGLVIAFMAVFFLPVHTADANVFNRIKDIYNAPDKVDELREQYDETVKSLEQQRQKLTEAESAMSQYAAEQQRIKEENELYRQQNEELRTQNALMAERLAQLEKDKADKQATYRRWLTMIVAAVALVGGYVLSIRIWRYSVWRSRKRLDGGV